MVCGVCVCCGTDLASKPPNQIHNLMKRISYLLAASSLFFAACDKDDDQNGSNVKEYKVGSYNDVVISGNVVVTKKRGSDQGTIIVRGNPELIANFEVRTDDDDLYITANSQAALSDSIYVELGDVDIEEITLTAQQHAVFKWVDDDRETLDDLEIETRGGSELWFYGLRADELDIDMAGNSYVYFDTHLKTWDTDSVWVAKSHAEVKGDFVIADLDSNSTFEVAYKFSGNISTKSKKGVDYYVITDGDVKEYYLLADVDIETTGTADIDGENAAILDLSAELSGNSTATVWVLGNISGEGNGSSILNFLGDPAITYNLLGSANILKL